MRLSEHAAAAAEHSPSFTGSEDGAACPGALLWVADAGGFTDERDLVASTAVRSVYWSLLIRPRPAGFRRQQGVSTAWDYDKVALLTEAVGIHPPVAWLSSNLCEGPLHGRRRDQWGQPGRWAKKVRDQVDRAYTDLQTLGGNHAAQIPAVRALADATMPPPPATTAGRPPPAH